MIKVSYENKQERAYASGEYPALEAFPTSVSLPQGWQAVLYEKDNFKGNSVVLSAHDGARDFVVAETVCPHPRSMRVLSGVKIVPGHKRDALALEAGLHGGKTVNDLLGDKCSEINNRANWLQKSLSEIPARMEWLTDAKFGCFVHWGVYATAGGQWKGKKVEFAYAEHIQRAAFITLEEYKEHFIDKFNPVDFDARAWIRAIKDAGMKYFVITTKHHDGFAMNVSDAYPYDIRMTPFKRDIMAELRDACEEYDIPFGMYYSHAFDWEHPDAPGNDWEYTNGGGDKFLFEGEKGRWFDQHPELVPRTAKYYVDQKSIPQILELIKKYRPALLWFDTPHKLPFSENLRILQAIREADPSVIVNGRLARNQDFDSLGDYVNTGDRAAEFFPTPGNWETIPTTNESYGYSKIDRSHKPPEHFIKMLVKTAARGGTVLMNLGPTEMGVIDPVDLDILKGVGDWLKINGESYYGTVRSPLPVQTFGETTLKGNKLYLHLFEDCEGAITLAGMINPVDRAYLLADGEKTPLVTKRLNYYDTQIDLPAVHTDFPALHTDYSALHINGKRASPTRQSAHLPAHTVIVVEFSGELLVGGGRLVSHTAPEFLRAFDASHIPQELSHGDGKTGREYVDGFSHTEEAVIWQVRTHKRTAYKLEVKYTTLDPDCVGAYSIYVNGRRYVQAITPAKALLEPIVDTFDVEIEGARDIVFRPETIDGNFLQLYGVKLIPQDAELAETIYIEEDTTDTGGK